jgi:hypothetical protein
MPIDIDFKVDALMLLPFAFASFVPNLRFSSLLSLPMHSAK